MISVLHILYELRSSGAEIMLKNAAPYWKEKGVVLHVLSTARVKGDFAENLALEGIHIHHIPYANSLAFVIKIYQLIHQYHFDVVQIHVERTFLTYSIIARLARVPIIIRTLHGTYLFEGLTRINRSIRRWFVRILGVIQVSVSAAIQQNEQKRFHNPTQQINNWYDDSCFYPPSDTERANARKRFNLEDGQKVIISIGNCAPVKNHDSIIKALAILKENMLPLEYWHIGEEDPEKLEQNLVNELNLNSMVKFWGRQNDVRDFLWAADVYIMPSFQEGLSIAMLEAFATQIPVILAKSPGLDQWAEFLPEIIYSNTTQTDIARKITLALKGVFKTRKANLNVFQTNFCVQQGAEKYYKLYSFKDL